MIKAVPLTYNGIRFRSTLEADWAATFDALGWYYEYEPWAVDLGDGIRYLCDFHLPAQNVWCEVKGGHNQRMHKTRRFHKATRTGRELVVVLRAAGPGGAANWHSVTGDFRRIGIFQCEVCGQWCFSHGPENPGWKCRTCGAPDALTRALGGGCRNYVSAVAYESERREWEDRLPGHGDDCMKEIFGAHGRLTFARAPRRGRHA